MISKEIKNLPDSHFQIYQSIRSQIEMVMEEGWRTLMITSPTLIKDQHMIAVNIASIFSKEGKKVLLINTHNKNLEKIRQIMSNKEDDYNHIIFHAADYLNHVDVQRLTNTCDGVLLILQEKVTNKADMLKTKVLLQKGRAQLIGTIYQYPPKVQVKSFFRKGRKTV